MATGSARLGSVDGHGKVGGISLSTYGKCGSMVGNITILYTYWLGGIASIFDHLERNALNTWKTCEIHGEMQICIICTEQVLSIICTHM